MRHLVDHRKLGRTASHRKALLRNMATSLILSERMETTLPKAKELRRVADELITLGKEGTLHARRQAARILQSDDALRKLFDGLAARFKDRQGGYTRIYKFGFRRGDSAEMAAIEYLGYQLPVAETEEAKKAKKEPKKEPKAKKEPKKEVKPKAEKKTSKKEAKEDSGKKGKWGLFGGKKKETE
jgi:ribosomal protein L17